MRTWSLVLASLAIAGLLLPGCGKKDSGKPKVAVVTNCTAEFWSICEAGATKAAQDFDVELVFRQPEKMSVDAQRPIVDAVVNTGVSGVAVSVIDPVEQTPHLKQVAKKVAFLAMDNDAPEADRLCYIGVDNYEAGKAVGRLVKQRMPQGGTIALFIGSTTSANAKARVGGVLDELAGQKDAKGPKYGNYTLYQNEAITDSGDEARAQTNSKDVLEKLKDTPNLACVGLYAYNPKQILLAARSKQMVGKVKIFGFDEDWLTLEGIAKGEIEATVVQDPFMYGYKSVEILAALARGDKSKLTKDGIPYRVITKDGGPEETVNGIKVVNLKADEFEKKLRADLASAKKN